MPLSDLLPPHAVPPELVAGASSAPVDVAHRIADRYRMEVTDALELVLTVASGE